MKLKQSQESHFLSSEEIQNEINTISEEFSNAIQDLPQFPQNIEKLNKLLDSDDSKFLKLLIR